jgi:hypothetical protein
MDKRRHHTPVSSDQSLASEFSYSSPVPSLSQHSSAPPLRKAPPRPSLPPPVSIPCLYTHQKLKKSKVWQDGIISLRGNSLSLQSDSGQTLETMTVARNWLQTVSDAVAEGNSYETETERYLLTIDDMGETDAQAHCAPVPVKPPLRPAAAARPVFPPRGAILPSAILPSRAKPALPDARPPPPQPDVPWSGVDVDAARGSAEARRQPARDSSRDRDFRGPARPAPAYVPRWSNARGSGHAGAVDHAPETVAAVPLSAATSPSCEAPPSEGDDDDDDWGFGQEPVGATHEAGPSAAEAAPAPRASLGRGRALAMFESDSDSP